MNKVIKNTAIYSLGEILPKVASFFLLPVFTRCLTTTEYGIISYTDSFMLLFTVLGALSLNTYALRFYFDKKDEKQKKLLLGTVYMLIGSFNLALVVIGWLIMPTVIDNYNIQVPWDPYFKLALINNFLASFNIIPLVIYRVRQDSGKYVLLNFSQFIIRLAFNIYFVVFLKQGIIGYYYSTLIVSIPFFFVYAKIISKYACFRLSWNYVKEGLKFSLPLVPGAIAYFFLAVSDRLILERNVLLSEIGIYNIATALTGTLGIVIHGGYHAVEPEIYGRYGNSDYYVFVKKAQTVFFSTIYVAAMSIALFSQEVFVIMTAPSFHEGYHLVPILIIGVTMSGQNSVYGTILTSEKRTKIQGRATMIGATLSLILNISFIPLLGTLASALTRMVSYIVMNTILFVKMTFPGKTMHRESLAILLIFIVPHIVFYFFTEISLVGIIIKILIVLTYIMMLMKMFNVKLIEVKKMMFKQ